MTTDQPASDPARPQAERAQRNQPFRVNDHGRVLGLVVTGLLLLGFLVLRLLTGAGDTPHIETASTTTAKQPPLPAATPDDQVHRLRPHTSSVIPMTHSEPIPAASEAWNPLSLDEWPAAPEILNDQETGLAREPELFR